MRRRVFSRKTSRRRLGKRCGDLVRLAAGDVAGAKELREAQHDVFVRMADDHFDGTKRIGFGHRVFVLGHFNFAGPILEWWWKRIWADWGDRSGVHLHF